MDRLTALTSVLTSAAFEADAAGDIITSNPPFVQLMRRVPGDDWRDSVDPQDRALVDAWWNSLFTNPGDTHQPISCRLSGSDLRFQLRGQTATDDDGVALSAVGIIVADDDSVAAQRHEVDHITGLPERSAAIDRIEQLVGDQRPLAVAVVLLSPEDSRDELLRKEAARQLLSTLRPTDMVASSPDGSFVLCAENVSSSQAATQMAERMSTALRDSGLAARIGLALPSDQMAAATMVREAEAGAWAATPGEVRFA
jgi:GGDEF domain-containing protein